MCAGNTYKSYFNSSACSSCPPRFFASPNHDTCWTIVYTAPPALLVSRKIFAISGLNLQNISGAADTSLGAFSIQVSVVKIGGGANSSDSIIASGWANFSRGSWSYSSIAPSLGANSPSNDFQWNASLIVPAITSMQIVVFSPVTIVDVAPAVASISPLGVSYSGSEITVQCEPLAPATSFFTSFTAPNISAPSCTLEPVGTSLLSSLTLNASVSLISSSAIIVTCFSPFAGKLGPPFSNWSVRIGLPDGRVSSTSNQFVTTYCPAGMYIIATAVNGTCTSPPCCFACPQPMSTSVLRNSVGISSCICQVGFYGDHGLGCRRCPPKLLGFNCTTLNLKLPIIKPGYWGDFSQLSKCREQDDACAAVATCPFGERACPGGSEKECTVRDDSCFEGRACSRCCPNYYLQSQSCIKCPDQTSLTTVIAVVCIVAVILAVFISTASSPSATQSTKYFVLGMNFFQGIGAIKLIEIEWPPLMLQMFDMLQFFSFSLSTVKPECAFSWSFATKVSLTLSLPIVMSSMLAAYGLFDSLFSCWKLHKLLQTLRSNGHKLPATSFKYLIRCWLHVLLFRKVVWHPDLMVWFALCPELNVRLTQKEKSDASAWQTARSKIQRRLSTIKVMGIFGAAKPVAAVTDFVLDDIIKLLKDNKLDNNMPRIIFYRFSP